MEKSKNALCRLCGAELQKERFKDIFDDADLNQKISNTLPINISPEDNASKQICYSCYNKVIDYYKFIRDILEYEKTLENIRSLHDISNNPRIDTDNPSSLRNDTIYTCPNCNADLMILLSTNPQNCDYNFQISLAVVGNIEKFHSTNENVTQIPKNSRYLHSMKNNNANEKLKVSESTSVQDTDKYVTEVDESGRLVQLHITKNHNKVHAISGKENSINHIYKRIKRKVKEDDIRDTSSILSKKAPKLELISYETEPEVLTYTYDCDDALVKIEPVNENLNWLSSEGDYGKVEREKTRKGNVKGMDENCPKNGAKPDENDTAKSCPRIVCELCGARYISQVKYEFHMERHKTDKIHKYVCTLCDKEASNENLLWDHYFHTHKSSQRYICMECGRIFTKRPRLNGHQKRHNHCGIKEINIETDSNDPNIDKDIIQRAIAIDVHGKVSVNCSLCGKLISDLDSDAINDLVTCASCEDSTLSLMVDGDEAKVISPRQYHCSQCPKHFVRRERLEFHEMRHSENMKEFICSTCGKDFSAENSLYEHYLFVHKGARPHICELCGKSFQLKARLKEHHRTHTGERPYQCDVCGQRCMTTNALRLHRKIHFSSNRYTCNICNKSFSKKQNMNEHLEKHWKDNKNVLLPQIFTCPICIEDFPTYRMLKYHMTETHKLSNQDPMLTKQKPWYECAECHEKFKHQMSLKAHRERVHEGKVSPAYECDTCRATYRVKQLLINHIKSKHNGEKRYKCAQCGKGFNDTKSLYNHILLHTGKKPYGCEFCNLSFRRKDSRDHHQRKHTGELPYQCPDCGESFSTYNSRSKHRKREHGEGESECPECGVRCISQQEIRFHLNKHLGEKLKKLHNL